MRFYSYEYMLSKVAATNKIQLILGAILIVILAISLWKYYKNKQDSKYRELAIIMVMGIFLIIGVEISQYQSTTITSDQYKQSVKFIEDVSKHLNIEKNKIYINSEAAIDGAIVKVEENYYRVLSSSIKGEYLLEKINLVEPNIEKVEVNS